MPGDTFEEALRETKKAAQDLARATAKLTRRLLEKAEGAAKDPRGSAKRAARTTAKGLESAARDVDELLKKL